MSSSLFGILQHIKSFFIRHKICISVACLVCVVGVSLSLYIANQKQLSSYSSFSNLKFSKLERRVFYVDCTYSMITLGLFDKVKEDVKHAIDAINDERTEIIVVPFSDKQKIHALPDPAWREFATSQGKARLKQKVDGMTSDTHTMTNHLVALNDFFNNWDNDNRTTFFYLITDGDNEENVEEFNNLLGHWSLRYLNRDVYGYYIMVDPRKSVQESVVDIINRQRHLWLVYGGLSEIRQLRVHNHYEYNLLDEEYVDVELSGDYNGCVFVSMLKEMADYRIEKAPVTSDGHLQIYLSPAIGKDSSMLPDTCKVHVVLNMANNPKGLSLIDDMIEITCINSQGKHYDATAVSPVMSSHSTDSAAYSIAPAIPNESLEAIAIIDAYIKGINPGSDVKPSHWELTRKSGALFLTYVGSKKSKVNVEDIESGIIYQTDMKFDVSKQNCDLYSIDWSGHHIVIESLNGNDGYLVIAISQNLSSIYNERSQSVKDFY